MSNYEIIATLGPASGTPDVWQALRSAGATAFRLNTSHLTVDELTQWLERLKAFREASGAHFPLVLDLQGSKWRLGNFAEFTLQAGQSVALVRAESADQPQVLPVPHADFFRAAPGSSGEIVLNDAKIRLRVETVEAEWVRAEVVQGGTLAARKGITFSASDYRSEDLSEKDRVIVEQTRGLDGVQYALSYVKDALEMAAYQRQLGDALTLIAKIERQPAVDEAAQIAQIADALWLCRGDLGAELGLRGMAEAAAKFSGQLGGYSKPSILAGQVLEHMTSHPTPTRSEVCYIYEALQQGYHGVVLSDETAIGRYPVESCRAAALFSGSGSTAR